MRNFQGINFIPTRTYREIFKSVLVWKLRIWSHLRKKSLMENIIFCDISLIFRRDYVQVFSCEFQGIFLNKIHAEHLRTTISADFLHTLKSCPYSSVT